MSKPEGERIATLEADVRYMRDALDANTAVIAELRQLMNEAKGGWKVIFLVGSVAASLGAFISKFIPIFNNG